MEHSQISPQDPIEKDLFSIESKFAWTNRFISIRQCVVSAKVSKDKEGPSSKEDQTAAMYRQLSEKYNSDKLTYIEETQGDPRYRFKINYLSKEHVKFFLLQEIMKQEPYFENET